MSAAHLAEPRPLSSMDTCVPARQCPFFLRAGSPAFGHVCPHCAHIRTGVLDVAWVTVRRAEDGKRRYQGRYRDASGAKRTVGTFGTDKAAMQAAVRAEIALAEGTWIDPRAGPTPFYGDYPLGRIMPSTFQEWANQAGNPRQVQGKARKGLSARSIVKYHVLLHSIFARAVTDRLVAFNPCEATDLPKVVTATTRTLTPDEYATLLTQIP